ncbi:MAG: PAS domain S-box protein, partial [Firmicutes bacterium]|nr:PAS domain S-box protein [Bacillota bacterium]
MHHDHGGPPLFPDALYRAIFENPAIAMILLEEDATIGLCNDEFARLAGLPRSEIEGRRSWTEFVHPDDLPGLHEYHRLRLLDPAAAPRGHEFRFVTAQGDFRKVLVTAGLVPGTKRSVASLTDITDLTGEGAPGPAEGYYRAIFEAADDAIFVHDPETGRILDANPKATEMYGYTAAEARRLTVEDLSAGVPPYTRQEAMVRIRKAAAGDPQRFEWLARDRKGRLFWVEVNLKRAALGGRNALLAIVRDVTVPKEMRARLEEERERFRVTLASIGDAVICTDPDGRITFMNEVAGRLTGWMAQEALGRPLGSVFHIVGELTGRPAEDPVARVLREGA